MNKFFRGLLLMASAATLAISFNACGDDDNVTPDETTGGSSAGSTSKGLVTKDATKVEFFSAVLNGYYIGKEDENYEFGFVISSKTKTPTLDENDGLGSYGYTSVSKDTVLIQSENSFIHIGETYYYRVYRMRVGNESDITYGNVVSFTAKAPKITVDKAEAFVHNASFTYTVSGELPKNRFGSTLECKTGIVMSVTNTDPLCDSSDYDNVDKFSGTGTGLGTVNQDMPALMANTKYYYRVYLAVNNQYAYSDVKSFTTKKASTPDNAIDLGLSVLWCDANVGAKKPQESGTYVAWGEVSQKTDYAYKTYKYCNGKERSLTKYNVLSEFGTVDNK